jgi:hypothetical protein
MLRREAEDWGVVALDDAREWRAAGAAARARRHGPRRPTWLPGALRHAPELARLRGSEREALAGDVAAVLAGDPARTHGLRERVRGGYDVAHVRAPALAIDREGCWGLALDRVIAAWAAAPRSHRREALRLLGLAARASAARSKLGQVDHAPPAEAVRAWVAHRSGARRRREVLAWAGLAAACEPQRELVERAPRWAARQWPRLGREDRIAVLLAALTARTWRATHDDWLRARGVVRAQADEIRRAQGRARGARWTHIQVARVLAGMARDESYPPSLAEVRASEGAGRAALARELRMRAVEEDAARAAEGRVLAALRVAEALLRERGLGWALDEALGRRRAPEPAPRDERPTWARGPRAIELDDAPTPRAHAADVAHVTERARRLEIA